MAALEMGASQTSSAANGGNGIEILTRAATSCLIPLVRCSLAVFPARPTDYCANFYGSGEQINLCSFPWDRWSVGLHSFRVWIAGVVVALGHGQDPSPAWHSHPEGLPHSSQPCQAILPQNVSCWFWGKPSVEGHCPLSSSIPPFLQPRKTGVEKP